MTTRYHYELPTAIPLTAPMGSPRSELTFSTAMGAASPTTLPLSRKACTTGRVTSPPPVVLTTNGKRFALAVAGVLLAVAFCLSIWATLWLLGHGLFITALASVCAFLMGFCLVETSRNKNAAR